jgi:hypothetical protein
MTDREHLAADTLDALHLGILPPSEKAHADEHLSGCQRCREALARLRADAEEFQQRVLPRTVDQVVERASRRSFWRRPAVWIAAPALAATAALLVFLVFSTTHGDGEGKGAGVRVKGDPVLRVYALRGDDVFKVRPGMKLRPADRIRFEVESAGARYLLVASKDGASQVSLYFPMDGVRSGRIPEGKSELPDSVELDQAPGPETLVAVFSAEPLTASLLLEALRAGPADDVTREMLPGAGHVVHFRFDKEVP